MTTDERGVVVDDVVALARLLRARAADGLWFAVGGSSMRPFLAPPARVHVVAVDRRPRLGEVWAYVDTSAELVVHRVAGHRKGRIVFVGDANPGRDELVDRARLVGLIDRIDRSGRLSSSSRTSAIRPLGRWARNALLRLFGRITEGQSPQEG